MKTLTFIIAIALPLICLNHAQAADAKEGKKLFHVVSLKFKADATPEQIKAVETAFAELKTKIPGVLSLNGGKDISPEGRAKGFTHCYVLTFASEADRDTYAKHPAHKAFGQLLGPVMADVMVIDFWGQE